MNKIKKFKNKIIILVIIIIWEFKKNNIIFLLLSLLLMIKLLDSNYNMIKMMNNLLTLKPMILKIINTKKIKMISIILMIIKKMIKNPNEYIYID